MAVGLTATAPLKFREEGIHSHNNWIRSSSTLWTAVKMTAMKKLAKEFKRSSRITTIHCPVMVSRSSKCLRTKASIIRTRKKTISRLKMVHANKLMSRLAMADISIVRCPSTTSATSLCAKTRSIAGHERSRNITISRCRSPPMNIVTDLQWSVIRARLDIVATVSTLRSDKSPSESALCHHLLSAASTYPLLLLESYAPQVRSKVNSC